MLERIKLKGFMESRDKTCCWRLSFAQGFGLTVFLELLLLLVAAKHVSDGDLTNPDVEMHWFIIVVLCLCSAIFSGMSLFLGVMVLFRRNRMCLQVFMITFIVSTGSLVGIVAALVFDLVSCAVKQRETDKSIIFMCAGIVMSLLRVYAHMNTDRFFKSLK